MSTADLIFTILSSASVSAALGAILIWLTKSWIGERIHQAIRLEYETRLENLRAQLKADFEFRIETHKAELKSRADVEIERLRSTLAIATSERNTVFTRLHERRVEVIANTYGRLQKLYPCIVNYAQVYDWPGQPSRHERRKEVDEAQSDFAAYFLQNRIFLPEITATLVEKVGNDMDRIIQIFATWVDRTPPTEKQGLIELLQKIGREVTETLRSLERELRRTLGDKD